MGHNGCDGSQASGPWAIGSGYRFNNIIIPVVFFVCLTTQILKKHCKILPTKGKTRTAFQNPAVLAHKQAISRNTTTNVACCSVPERVSTTVVPCTIL